MVQARDKRYMREAIEQAAMAEANGEVPVGAVLVSDGQVISRAHNRSIRDCDPSAHAEIIALRVAATTTGNYRLLDSTLYVTLEPCAMCFAALVHARIARLVYGARDPKTGVCGGAVDITKLGLFNHQFEIVSDVLASECSALLKGFFAERRTQGEQSAHPAVAKESHG